MPPPDGVLPVQAHRVDSLPNERGSARRGAGLARNGTKKLPDSVNGACPMLDPQSGKCLIYAHRPFGCRTHFCAAAGGPLARRDVLDLIRRLETLDAQLGGNGPRKLPGAITAALREIA